MLRIEVDGEPATADHCAPGLLANYGHFTALQVRDRRVRGLHRHLHRLDQGNRELYGTGLDGDHVRTLVHHALGDLRDAAVRVIVFGADAPSVMVVVRPPLTPPAAPQRLMSAPYTRPLPHVKHLGGFGQLHHRTLARRAGHDDALLTADGVVVEGSTANIAFLDGDDVVWPQADWLHGVTMQLLEQVMPTRREVIRSADVGRYRGAFLTNSIGVVGVSRIDHVEYEVDAAALARVQAAYDAVPADPLD
ncbi:aminotransferase class IV [Saccharothrix sp. HUAS TT1]|uniref:aminotransferase class IV n=1 Tax=unclassified Saccharothrix TaxID=2593673 RepID=UPI00345BE9A1